MLSHQKVVRFGFVFLIGVVLAMVPVVRAGQVAPEDAEKLLADARAQAAQLEKDALVLKAYTTGEVAALAKGHGALIERIQQDVNRAGSLSFRMRSAQRTATPAQQVALDRIDPLLKELAATLNGTIMRIPHVSTVVQKPPYTEYLTANARVATDLAKTIALLVDYAESKAKALEMEHLVELINYD